MVVSQIYPYHAECDEPKYCITLAAEDLAPNYLQNRDVWRYHFANYLQTGTFGGIILPIIYKLERLEVSFCQLFTNWNV